MLNGEMTYAYYGADQLVSARNNDETRVAYGYDALGRTALRTENQDDSFTRAMFTVTACRASGGNLKDGVDPDICLVAYDFASQHDTNLPALGDVYPWLKPVLTADGGGGLPPRTIVDQNGVTIDHYYHGIDHGPAHAHVYDNRGNETKIGTNGNPIKGQPELTPRMREVIRANRATIRSALKQIGRWLEENWDENEPEKE